MKPLNYMTAAEKVNPKLTGNGAFLTVQAENELNTMTVSWWNIGFIWHRPILTVAVRPTRHTFHIIEKAADFTLSIPEPDTPEILAKCGSQSGRALDKFKAFQLDVQKSKSVSTPIIRLPGVHYECRIMLRSPMDATKMHPELETFYSAKDYHTMYFGEIMECYQLEA